MKIEKGEIVQVSDRRKGKYRAQAQEAYDTEADEWYPLVTLDYVRGMATEWEPGDDIPARRGISFITKIEYPKEGEK